MAGKAKRSNVWNYFPYCQEEDRLELKLWNFSCRTSTRTKIFGTRSSRTSTRTKIFGSVVPELVLELKVVETLFEELVLELKFWNCSSRTSTRTKIFGTHSSRTSTRTKIFGSVVPELVQELNYGTTTTLKIAYRKITGRGFMTVCHNKQRLYVNMISKSS